MNIILKIPLIDMALMTAWMISKMIIKKNENELKWGMKREKQKEKTLFGMKISWKKKIKKNYQQKNQKILLWKIN